MKQLFRCIPGESSIEMGNVISCVSSRSEEDEVVVALPAKHVTDRTCKQGVFNSCRCIVSHQWKGGPICNCLVMNLTAPYSEMLSWYFKKPTDIPFPIIDNFVLDVHASAADKALHFLAWKATDGHNNAAWSHWHDVQLSVSEKFVQSLLEHYATVHCLDLPLGFEMRSNDLLLRFATKSQREEWLCAPSDDIFIKERTPLEIYSHQNMKISASYLATVASKPLQATRNVDNIREYCTLPLPPPPRSTSLGSII